MQTLAGMWETVLIPYFMAVKLETQGKIKPDLSKTTQRVNDKFCILTDFSGVQSCWG